MLVTAPAAHAERFALVIGNQAYNDKVGPLRNPHNDIAVVGKALAEVGFKVLGPRKDATRDDILFAVHELAAQVRNAGRDAVSFLYYAGHGVGVGAENVLIPTNAENTTDAMLSVRGVRLGEVLDILKREAPDAVHFVVLDACRNNLRGQRGSRGFVPVNDRRTGVVIAFSTAQGETATDEGAKNAPYAAALAEEIVKPGRNDQAVFNAVRARVVSAAQGQTPWTHDGLVGERVVFKATAPVAPAPTQPGRLSEAAEAWDRTKDLANLPALEAFIRRFGDTYYGDLAKVRLAELRQAEAGRLAAEAAKTQADEAARAKAEAERQRVALLQQEEQRKRAEAEAAKRKEDEEARAKADAERQQLTQSAHIQEAQERLYELNYDPGPANGTLNQQTEQAIREFEGTLGSRATGRLTEGLLRRLRSAGTLAPWGAIAFSDATEKWGMSWSHDTRKAAVTAAQASCGANPSACSKALTFFGTGCGAFAHSAARWSLVARDTSARARLAALEECQKQGARCSIVASLCAGGQDRSQ